MFKKFTHALATAAMVAMPLAPVGAVETAVPTLYDGAEPTLISAQVITSYKIDTPITVGSGTLIAKAGSSYTSLEVVDGKLHVTVPAGHVFELRTSSPPVVMENDALLPTCDILQNSSNRLMISAPSNDRTVSVYPGTSNCSTSGAGSDTTPALAFSVPAASGVLEAGAQTQVFWQTMYGTVASVSMQLSTDGGKTYPHDVLMSGSPNNGFLSWVVPEVYFTNEARLRIYGWNNGNIVAIGVSDAFTINGEPAPVEEEGSLTVDLYDYEVDEEIREAATISIDKALTTQVNGFRCTPETRMKAKGFDTLYYCGTDGKRYVFPNEKTHRTWYGDSFAGVVEWELEDIAQIPLAGNVTYRPGSRMVKVQSAPEVFAVAANGTLRYVASEAVAERLYGPNWNQYIDDIPDAFFTNYTIGTPIYE